MRTWTQMLGVAALALGVASMASAGTIDLIFTGGCTSGNGTAACTTTPNAVVTADVTLTFGGGDTQMGGPGSAYQISLDYTAVSPGPVSPSNTTPAGWFPAGASADNGAGFVQSAFNAVDLFGTNLLTAGTPYTLGSVTLTAANTGLVFPTLGGAGDAIIGSGGGIVNGEYTLNGGLVTVPEPTTAALLGIGLGLLGIVGRRR